MREVLQGWGVGLSEDDFAGALAARIAELGSRAGWAELRRRWPSKTPAAEYAAKWRARWDERGVERVVLPDVERTRGHVATFALGVMRLLSRAESIGSAVARAVDHRTLRQWRWPLHVAFVGPVDVDVVEHGIHFDKFIKVSPVDERPVDILFVAGSLREALPLTMAPDSLAQARCVIVLDGVGRLSTAAIPSTLGALRASLSAHALAVVGDTTKLPTARAERSRACAVFVNDLAAQIAHDQLFDDALFLVARDRGDRALLSANVRFLDRTKVSRRLSAISKRYSHAKPPEAAGPPPQHFSGMAKLAAKEIGDVGAEIEANPGAIDWKHESGAASGLADMVDATAPVFEEAAKTSPPRFLQTRITPKDSTDEQDAVSHLRPATPYRIAVWIGARQVTALGLPRAFPILSEVETHDLDVIVHEPRLFPEPQRGTLRLAPRGDTKPAEFFFQCPPGVKSIHARVVVMHRGRVLQTGVVRGGVSVAPAAAPKEALSFEPDVTPRTLLATLGSRSLFGAAVIANHDDDGTGHQLAVSGGLVGEIKLNDSSLKGLVDCFDSALSDIAANPDDYAGLRSKGTLNLLRELAQHGARLHETLVDHNGVGKELAAQPRLQIITARVDGFLPLELAYAFAAPDDDAKLCKGAEKGLAKGKCPPECGAPGGAEDKLCPLGFWCTSKVIERFAHRTVFATDGSGADYTLRAEPIGARPPLPLPRSCLVAASDNAEKSDKKAVANLLAKIPASVTKRRVDDWEAWAKEVSKDRPGLLVLLPHHAQDGANSLLEIGAKSRLKATLVRRKHIVGEPEPAPPTAPIVLLLGCETSDAKLSLEAFPAVMQDRGAALVIATIATVLGRDAAPTASAIIDALIHQGTGKSFGDVLLEARRTVLAGGKPMVLALAGFGDADWVLS